MKKRKLAGVVAGIMALSCIMQALQPSISAEGSSYTMNVAVNLNGERKAISPYIYGVNDFVGEDNLSYVKTSAMRQGGNRYSGYNWETNWSNAGADWYHSSDTYLGDAGDGAAYAATRLSQDCVENNVPYKIATLQMAGYVAADKRFDGMPLILETPDESRWAAEIQMLRDLTQSR